MYASDYPHTDSKFPHSVKAVRERGDLSDETKDRLLGANASALLRSPAAATNQSASRPHVIVPAFRLRSSGVATRRRPIGNQRTEPSAQFPSVAGPTSQLNAAAGTSTRIVTTEPIGGAPSASCDACSVYRQANSVRPSSPPSSHAKAPCRCGRHRGGHRAARLDAKERASHRVADPERALGVEGDPVGDRRAEVGEVPPSRERAVVVDVELGDPVRRRLGDQQCRLVRGQRAPVRESSGRRPPCAPPRPAPPGPASPAPAWPHRAGRSRSGRRRRRPRRSTIMSLQRPTVTGARSATTVSSSCSRRSSRRPLMSSTSSSPSAVQPRPPGPPGTATTVRTSPAAETTSTRPARFSESHSSPSCQRGHSGNARPSTSGCSGLVTLILPATVGDALLAAPHRRVWSCACPALMCRGAFGGGRRWFDGGGKRGLVVAATGLVMATSAYVGDVSAGTTEPGTTEPGTDTTEPGTGTTEPGTDTTEPRDDRRRRGHPDDHRRLRVVGQLGVRGGQPGVRHRRPRGADPGGPRRPPRRRRPAGERRRRRVRPGFAQRHRGRRAARRVPAVRPGRPGVRGPRRAGLPERRRVHGESVQHADHQRQPDCPPRCTCRPGRTSSRSSPTRRRS